MRSASVLSVLGLSLLTLWGCGNNPTPTATNTGTPAASPSLTTAASPPAGSKQPTQLPSPSVDIGKPIKLGKYQFTVNGVRESAGDEISKPKQGQKFLMIDATVENQGEKREAISSITLFTLSDSNNKKYERVITTDAKGSLDSNLDPGKSLKGEIAFEVPKDAKNLQLIVRGDLVEPRLQAKVKLN